MSDKAKYRVLEKIADGQLILDAGRAKKRIGVEVVHYRWNSIDRNRPEHFKFNINNNTLTANWELWICGSEDLYYLLPIEVIKEMYHDPDSYADNTHSSQNIKVVSVNTSNNTVTYASGSKQIDIKAYRDSTLSGNPRTIEPALITSFKFGSSGEQDEHLSLKNWIADNPGFINVTEVVKTEVENGFPLI